MIYMKTISLVFLPIILLLDLSLNAQEYNNLDSALRHKDICTYLRLNLEDRDFPIQIFELEKLEVLEILQGNFTEVPEQILCLKFLKRLLIKAGRLSEFPCHLCELKYLEDLSLPDNKIIRLPPCIGSFQSLNRLNLNSNPIRRIPKSLGKLSNLNLLSLGYPDGRDMSKFLKMKNRCQHLLPNCKILM
jgi:Leucine-rich repeat (LRR) protein